MRSIVTAVTVLSALLLTACGNSPRIFKIAIDRTNEKQIGTPSCFKDNNPPQFRPLTTQNLFEDAQWVIWDGETNVQYLDVGSMSVSLADAARFTVSELIKGDTQQKSFTAVKQATCAGNFSGGATPICLPSTNSTAQVNWTAAFNFDRLDSLATGTVAVQSSYVCTGQNCLQGAQVPYTSCTATLSFVGRRVDAQPLTAYSPSGNTN